MSAAPVRTFQVRNVQVARALFAALAAAMVTFSPDHSAGVGLAVFSGWAIATALVLLFGAWLAYGAGARATPVLLGVLTLVTGMIAGLPGIRSTTLFFVLVIAWALATGLVELISGIRRRAVDEHARDAILIGAVTLALGVGLLLVNPAYSLEYFIREAGQTGVLTGITIGVGLFGGYAAVVAVFLGIAGFSPRRSGDDHATSEVGPAVGQNAEERA
ncbi:MAG: acyl-CoA synthetase [Candidatus Microbacterium phytovorans]|uniref:Acyl-CoA synthetase n=1 Tax=Candidatus Microbacterium phytovorans TaxID=3121374 RepID=A0AAJ5VZI6_9MICO|nr:acyl-CoA synthetase [Microbacterium sp.]WEK13119.1 MAG: acyl-CoA synthetase [Microbacterium sp.]